MEHTRTFGSRGTEPGQLEYPCGIAIRGEEVYVAEYGNHRISVFTKRGNFERVIGSEGKAPGQFYQPRGLLFVRGWLVVTEPKRVSVLAPDGEVRQTVELPGAGQLWGVCKDENRVYVTDIRAGQAKVFVLTSWARSTMTGAATTRRRATRRRRRRRRRRRAQGVEGGAREDRQSRRRRR